MYILLAHTGGTVLGWRIRMSNLVFMVGVSILAKSVNPAFPTVAVVAICAIGAICDLLHLLFKGVK